MIRLRRIWGLMYRHLCLYRRSWPRLVDLAYWPVLQMVIWGFTGSFFAARLGNHGAVAAGMLLGGVLLWELAIRSHLGLAVTFMEEIWSRNLGHLFISPLRPWEMLVAFGGMSILRMIMGLTPAALLAWVLYHFNILSIGPVLFLFAINLMVMGWMHPVVYALPAAHIFEGMRAVLTTGEIRWDHLAWAAGLNLLWSAAAIALFTQQFYAARRNGALMNIGE